MESMKDSVLLCVGVAVHICQTFHYLKNTNKLFTSISYCFLNNKGRKAGYWELLKETNALLVHIYSPL